ncbi:hypothetical protein AB833_22530 [Chromatiales bacterium (ex Bugula neritina AB1)]|nr:hypothetical protein AB833_22530 [Chromatiales bacterium (ex Bugula neritina AB1)]
MAIPALVSAANADDNFTDCRGSSTLEISEKGIKVEVANDQRSRNYGLMFRSSLGENCGMVFVFPTSRFRTFTMRNTLIPLDIAFMDANGEILEIQTMQPGVDRYPSRVKARYVLEMNAGWFSSNNIEKGQTLELRSGDELVPINSLK